MQPLNSQNDPGDQKNLLLAVLLSACVFLGWQFFYAGPKVQKERERQAAIEAQKKKTPQAQSSAATGGTTGGAAPSAPGNTTAGSPPPVPGGGSAPIATSISRSAALARSKRIPIVTPSLTGSFNLSNGRIDDIELVKYHETPDQSSPKIVMFSPADAAQPYFAEHGWVAGPKEKVKLPGPNTPWTVEGDQLTPSKPLKLTWQNGEGLTFKRTISVDDNYMFTISDEVENKSGKAVALLPYGRIFRYGKPKIEGFWVQHEGMIGFLGEKKLQKLNYTDALEPGGNKTFKDALGGWIGFTDKYWAAALIPNQKEPYLANMVAKTKSATSKEYFQTDYLLPAISVADGGSQKVEQRLFVGAKKVDLINAYEAEGVVFEFNYLIDWGWFFFITKPLYQLLNWLFGLLGNFGVAILAVTVIVKAAFFWFANKSYESMAKMKKLQPEMTRLRDRYKDDKVQQQKELMELYKKEKINPLAGCLPVLIQIPVFFALYKVLFISIDMRHAPFFAWIQDLSAKDPTSLFNLFGLLPYTVPEFLIVGIWPLLMGITMWIQMQLNPQQPDPVQQQVFNWMPVMFTFLLASFPAGLVIYWCWNNVLSLMQQWFIMKRQGVDVPLMDNLRRNFSAIGKFVGDLTSRSKS